MARMQRSLFAQLNALAEEISQSKSAAVKSAGPVPADPGGYQGASTHPSVSADNGVQDAPEGARASEYESDIKDQQGAVAVDNTPEMSQEGRQDDVQLNINTHASTVGEDPSVEKDYKGTKDDPGTSHPAKANDGEKYSSVSFKQARDMCGNLGNDILANIINFGADKLTKQSEMPEALKEHAEEKKDDAGESKGELKGDQHKLDVDNDGKIEGSDLAALRAGKEAAFKAGYEIAKAAGVEKEAAEAAVREVCANTLRDADVMADLLIGFLSSQKAANSDVLDEAAEGEDHSAPGDDDSGAGDAPADGGGLESMMAGEEAAPAEMGMGGEMGGAPSEDEAVQELAMALEELGISPEELLSAVSEGGAGGEMGGGEMPMPPAGGAPAPEMEMAPKMAAARDLNDIGRAVVNFKRAGKFQVKEARTKRSRELRDTMKQHVLELLNR